MATTVRRRRVEEPILQWGCLAVVFGAFAFGLPCSGLMGVGMLATGPVELAVATGLAVLFTVPYGLWLLWLDRNEHEPLWLVATAFLWGALVATSLSGIGNAVFGSAAASVLHPALAMQATASFSAPPVEESTKALALLALMLVFGREVDNVLDGVLYGAIIGLGFAWFENITYYVQVGVEGGIGEMFKLAYVRGLLNGVGSHAAYTGLTGLGFGLWRVMRRGWLRWLMPPFMWVVAMFAHFVWNTFAWLPTLLVSDVEWAQYLLAYPTAVLVLQVPFLLLLGVVVLLAWTHEDRIIREFLNTEPSDVIGGDVDHLVPARRRNWAGFVRLVTQGPFVWWRQWRVESNLIALAFVKWHHHRDLLAWDAEHDEDVIELRRRIRAMRA